jgi:hypothetical protein
MTTYRIYIALLSLWARIAWWLMETTEQWAQAASYQLEAEEHYAQEALRR